jgi:hypothetical protein
MEYEASALLRDGMTKCAGGCERERFHGELLRGKRRLNAGIKGIHGI